MERGGRTMGLMNFAYRVLRQREACRAFDTAPHLPIAGTSTASSFNEKPLVDLPFFDDAIPSRAAGIYSEQFLLIRLRLENPSEAWGAFCSSRIAIFVGPECVQMDEGGERANGNSTDLRLGGRIKLPFRSAGAHHWILERRKEPASGIYYLLAAINRFGSKRILTEVQCCLDTLPYSSGF